MSMRFGLIGNNISYSKSPKIHQYMSHKLHIDITYDLLDVEAAELPKLIEQLRQGYYQGFNVTTPYKEAIISYLDDISYRAKSIQAVNTIYYQDGMVKGENTDYDGFVGVLKTHQIDVKSKNVYVLGTGGAAKAIYHALCDLGAHVTMVSRNKKDKEKEFEHVIEYRDLNPNSVDLYIQATPVGTFPNVNASVLTKEEVKGKTVIDLVYNPSVTQIMKDSKKGVGGINMLIIQALKCEEIWFEREIELTNKLISELKGVIFDE
ncbi:MAG: shikimate dehydrogenase [Firmicutes bacterium]|nr:shikimate dehydrogenase [Bacillota bacterium]